MFFKVPAGASNSGASRVMAVSTAKAGKGKRLVRRLY
jgi:hypothetical protein